MKTSIKIFAILLATGLMGACNDDFLERYPKSQISPQAFFNNEAELKLYTNSFYNYLPGEDIFTDDFSSDNIEQGSINNLVAGRTIVPTSASEAGWTWGQLYNINYFIANYRKAYEKEKPEIVNHYGGIARFYRALFYFEKVKRFGDVPWYSDPLYEGSPDLYKPRDSRQVVIDSVMADLNFAIAHVRPAKNVSRVTKWAALALKSRVGLFEGTFRKYHTELGLESSADALLREAAAAAKAVIDGGQYNLYNTGKPYSDYLQLFAAESANTTEVILARVYDQEFNKSTPLNNIFTSPTRGTPGYTKSFVNSYLTIDGEPISQRAGYPELTFWEETRDRDPRMYQTLRTPGYTRIGQTTPLRPDFANAYTGYHNVKFVTGTDRDGGGNTNDLPVFRYAEVLLNYAEAKAELGEFTQADADLSINKIRARAGMPALDVNAVTPDPFLLDQYQHTDDVLVLEVRRERRIELALEGFRYTDLMRWKEGDLLAETFEGMYFPGPGVYDLDNDGKNDVAIITSSADAVSGLQNILLGPERALSNGTSGNLIVHPQLNKVFEDPKHYLFPLPITELLLNDNLDQNPGWEQ